MTIIAFDMGLRVDTPKPTERRRVDQVSATDASHPVREMESTAESPSTIDLYTDVSQHGHASAVATAADIMSSPVTSIPSDCTCAEAWQLFQQTGFRQLPVVDSKRLSAMLSERDLLRHWITNPAVATHSDGLLAQGERPVLPLSQRPVLCAQPETDLMTLGHLFSHYRVDAVPILDGDEPVGIVSRGDFIETVADKAEYSFWV